MDIIIPDDKWELNGYEDDPTACLLTTITVNGVNMHLEAIAVEIRDGEQFPVTDWDENYYAYYRAAGADGDFRPVTISGRQYVLFASPFCT